MSDAQYAVITVSAKQDNLHTCLSKTEDDIHKCLILGQPGKLIVLREIETQLSGFRRATIRSLFEVDRPTIGTIENHVCHF